MGIACSVFDFYEHKVISKVDVNAQFQHPVDSSFLADLHPSKSDEMSDEFEVDVDNKFFKHVKFCLKHVDKYDKIL